MQREMRKLRTWLGRAMRDVQLRAGEITGERLAFEMRYWGGDHPATDPEEEPDGYPLPFHPIELGEEALREFFGFQLEGFVDATLLEPERIRMLCFDDLDKAPARGERAWWKFW